MSWGERGDGERGGTVDFLLVDGFDVVVVVVVVASGV